MLGALAIHFAIPAVSYVVAPEMISAQFSQIAEILGAGPYTVPEAESRIWRYLGAANVMTLALMCALLQYNLRKFYVVLVPLVFLKGYNASLFLGDFLMTGHPAFLAVALWDFSNCWMFWFFSKRALADIAERADADLVPRPKG